jgi:hypothetical protein
MVYFQFPTVKYLKVSYPAPETYFTIPHDWQIEDLQVKHGALYHKGRATLLVPHDFVSTKQELEIIDEGNMDWEDCRSFMGD